MRTRTRNLSMATDPGEEYVILQYDNPNYPYVVPRPSLSFESLTEEMVDEEPKLQRSGTCLHTKVERKFFSASLKYSFPHNGTYNASDPLWPIYTRSYSGWALGARYMGGNYMSWCEPVVIVPYLWDWKTLSYAAVQQMKPSLNKEGLLLNNTIIDTGKMANEVIKRNRQLNDRAQQGLSPIGQVPRPLKGWRNRAIGSLKVLSGMNLVYQFVVLPMCRDTEQVLDRCQNLKRNLETLIAHGKKIQTRHYTCPLADRITLPADLVRSTQIPFADYPGWSVNEITRWDTRPTYHATMRFKYDTSALEAMLGSLRATLDSLGVSRVLSTIWEAIPYSFVVDWFVNVQSMLRSLESHIDDPMPLQILDFVHSIKYKYTSRLLVSEGSGAWLIQSDIPVKERTITYYQRVQEAPNLWDELKLGTPSLNQLGLGGSIVLLRKLEPSRPRGNPHNFIAPL